MINNKIRAIKSVKKVRVFQHIKKWIQDWFNEELDTKLHSRIIEKNLISRILTNGRIRIKKKINHTRYIRDQHEQ